MFKCLGFKMMKKILLVLAAILPLQIMAADADSIYTWGAWSQGIKPAAGPVAKITPAPAKLPDVNFRPNENAAFLREATTVEARLAPGVSASSPQIANVAIVPSGTPSTSRDRF